MEKFIIENRAGDDYITSIEHGFTLKVIPPDKQDEERDYIPYQVVGTLFADSLPLEFPECTDLPDDTVVEFLPGKGGGYDFQGVDISFSDDDVPGCNKPLWVEAINYYCQLVLDRELVTVFPYNYNYEFSELNCSPETLAFLNGNRSQNAASEFK